MGGMVQHDVEHHIHTRIAHLSNQLFQVIQGAKTLVHRSEIRHGITAVAFVGGTLEQGHEV